MGSLKEDKVTSPIEQICEVCGKNPAAKDKSQHMLICDDCHHYFDCMTEANDSLGEAFSVFVKANPNKHILECMRCTELVALESRTENDYCPRCGGELLGDDD